MSIKQNNILVSCERCQSQYSVQVGLLGVRRLVRCSVCRHVWNEGPVTNLKKTENPVPRENEKRKPLYWFICLFSFSIVFIGAAFWILIIKPLE